MKLSAVYTCFWVGVLLSCGGLRKDSVRDFMPGVYERGIDNEFSKGRDQLIVQLKQGNVYTIEKRSAIIRIRNGTSLPVKYDTVTWTGIYDETNQVIYEQRGGKVISFLPEENKLLVGGSEYRKVNE